MRFSLLARLPFANETAGRGAWRFFQSYIK